VPSERYVQGADCSSSACCADNDLQMEPHSLNFVDQMQLHQPKALAVALSVTLFVN